MAGVGAVAATGRARRRRLVEGVAAMGTRGRYRVSRFYGRNKFLCGERLMVGPDWKGTLITAVCIIVPAVLYFTITYVLPVILCAVGCWSREWVGGLCGSCSVLVSLFPRRVDGAETGRRRKESSVESS